MSQEDSVGAIARAVLYEGYVLYPYRTTSLKNSKPSMIGTLYPARMEAVQQGHERSSLRMECLVLADGEARISARLRFLQLTSAQVFESLEREVVVEATIREVSEGIRRKFAFEEGVRLQGELEVKAEWLASGAVRLTLGARNLTPASDPLGAFHSAHVVAAVDQGRFVSMTDPPANHAEDVSGCSNLGVWPILVGDPEAAATMLGSPIILSDYPQIAPESPGDLHDSSEIDEILTLRILTMTEEEKASARASGERARDILDRTEALTRENLAQLHGAFREPDTIRWSSWDTGFRPPISVVRVDDTELAIGDRVRLRPKNRADILDTALTGCIATIAAIEQDLENRLHVAVVVDEDPGRDLGELRKPGHRFFFSPDEVEPA